MIICDNKISETRFECNLLLRAPAIKTKEIEMDTNMCKMSTSTGMNTSIGPFGSNRPWLAPGHSR